MAAPGAQRFWALPQAARRLCESFGEDELLRVCEPYLLLHCSSAGGNEAAGEAAGEALTADHPDDERREGALSVRAQLVRLAGWRRVLAPDYICAGGFTARLAGDTGAAGPQRWASEEHYVRAAMLQASDRPALARQLSLDSNHAAAASISAARALLRASVPAGGRGLGFAPGAYEIATLRNACMTAASARFTQHALSRAVLLATGRALLTAHTVWSPSALNLSAMAARENLLRGLPAPHPAGWWPVPTPEQDGAEAVAGRAVRAAPLPAARLSAAGAVVRLQGPPAAGPPAAGPPAAGPPAAGPPATGPPAARRVAARAAAARAAPPLIGSAIAPARSPRNATAPATRAAAAARALERRALGRRAAGVAV